AGSARRQEGKPVAAIRRWDKVAPSPPRPLPGGLGPGTAGPRRTGGGPMSVAFPRLPAPLTAALLLAAVASLRAADFEKKSEIGFGAGAPYPVAFSPDGKLLAAGTDRGSLKVWDLAGAKFVADLKGHTH